jgi:hypothetical protein
MEDNLIHEENPRGHSRGHTIVFDYDLYKWLYEDDLTPLDDFDRPCKKCGRPPTEEGYDACIGFVEGMTSVCCGHGVANPIMMKEEELKK